jgi:hypothetical protein
VPVTNDGGPIPDAKRSARHRARHGSDPQGPGRRRTHGLRSLERVLRQHGLAAVDGRSTLARELAEWRRSLTDDLGGDPSTAQAILIERVAAKRLLVGALETFILQHPSTLLVKENGYLVNLYRQTSDSLRADLIALGLERRAKPVEDQGEPLNFQLVIEAPSVEHELFREWLDSLSPEERAAFEAGARARALTRL